MRLPLRAWVVVVALVLGAGASRAQLPAIPSYAYPAQSRPVLVPVPTRSFVVAPAPRSSRRLYVAAPGVVRYAPRGYPTTVTPSQRYRRAIRAGRDPNWASGRGMRLDKPWED